MKTHYCFVVLAVASLAPAQWINYPTPGIPRTADGKPNLNAPPPRTSDGKPDLSGMWKADDTKSCSPPQCTYGRPAVEYADIGDGFKEGLPYRPSAAALVKERIENNRLDDPGSHCLPQGPIRKLTHPSYKRFIQIPGRIVILHELDTSYQEIFTDGRTLPVNPQPTWYGYSVGKWEGDTLVVETSGLRDGLWLDAKGNPLTDAAKLTTRFHRVSFGKMEVEVRIDDPKAYTKPWTVRLDQLLVLDTELLENFCVENEKDVKHLVGK